eukprot:TRINITY_DN92934_c0_g1_i1.p1 TRINITY_DN92934_c0_g1~~TRINITY_DN92934_c0_g1_i1.p1  ORF type:complete len:724 (+),score=151.99 TRINITY_DN92934_c0_g1_i1:82-2253(+)
MATVAGDQDKKGNMKDAALSHEKREAGSGAKDPSGPELAASAGAPLRSSQQEAPGSDCSPREAGGGQKLRRGDGKVGMSLSATVCRGERFSKRLAKRSNRSCVSEVYAEELEYLRKTRTPALDGDGDAEGPEAKAKRKLRQQKDAERQAEDAAAAARARKLEKRRMGSRKARQEHEQAIRTEVARRAALELQLQVAANKEAEALRDIEQIRAERLKKTVDKGITDDPSAPACVMSWVFPGASQRRRTPDPLEDAARGSAKRAIELAKARARRDDNTLDSIISSKDKAQENKSRPDSAGDPATARQDDAVLQRIMKDGMNGIQKKESDVLVAASDDEVVQNLVRSTTGLPKGMTGTKELVQLLRRRPSSARRATEESVLQRSFRPTRSVQALGVFSDKAVAASKTRLESRRPAALKLATSRSPSRRRVSDDQVLNDLLRGSKRSSPSPHRTTPRLPAEQRLRDDGLLRFLVEDGSHATAMMPNPHRSSSDRVPARVEAAPPSPPSFGAAMSGGLGCGYSQGMLSPMQAQIASHAASSRATGQAPLSLAEAVNLETKGRRDVEVLFGLMGAPAPASDADVMKRLMQPPAASDEDVVRRMMNDRSSVAVASAADVHAVKQLMSSSNVAAAATFGSASLQDVNIVHSLMQSGAPKPLKSADALVLDQLMGGCLQSDAAVLNKLMTAPSGVHPQKSSDVDFIQRLMSASAPQNCMQHDVNTLQMLMSR